MAETPLTDSIEALTTYANQVTGASDTNLSDAVYTLAQGYGGGGTDYLRYANKIDNLFASCINMPEEVILNLDNFGMQQIAPSSMGSFMFRAYTSPSGDRGNIKVELHLPDVAGDGTISFGSAFYQAYGVGDIKVTGDLSKVTSYSCMLDYLNSIKTCDMVIDGSSVTAADGLTLANAGTYTFPYLTRLLAKPNTLKTDVKIPRFSALDDTSIISFANGLSADVTGKTIIFHTTPKERCSTLMGVNDNGTFVIDATGALSLADFITTVKGWTLQ